MNKTPAQSTAGTARPLILGHRGASAHEPENTLAAFRLAVEQGADGVELDVRTSADGVPVVHHDPVLADGRAVEATVRHELPAEVPTLADVLVAGPWFLNVEIKPVAGDPDAVGGLVDPVIDLLHEHGASARTLVSSFDLAILDRVRSVDPGLALGWLVSPLSLVTTATTDPVTRAMAHGAVALHPADVMVDAALIGRAHASGLAVNVWTVDDPVRITELARLGVDAVITNDPALASRALGRS